ncbi:hypothetical protein [Streptomyces sp. NBC_01212]|uniref:hypothetical protein n=1 Tax=Streptomyces sp. NBC_01212 TaxID=2903775 RepID=UPI002E147D72|nr:hypothetical protein OG722_04845 [Streptomyces sp. NBC_01212]
MPELTEAVQLTDPLGPQTLEPVPNPGCEICQVLGRQREAARAVGDGSVVSDCNVEIRQHPHPRKAARR